MPNILPVTLRTLSIICVCLLAACANPSVQQLKSTPEATTPFGQKLASLYLHYAEAKQNSEQMDKATLFANKGLAASKGEEVLPEMAANWPVDAALKPEFVTTREQIVALLTEQNKANKAEAAAGAIFSYDCWLDQTAMTPDSPEAGYCRSSMENAIAELSNPHSDMADEGDQTPMDAGAANRYVVYFELNEYRLSDQARATLYKAYQDLSRLGKVTIAVNGHTDTSGNDRYNMMLSNQRAGAVKELLVTLGMDAAYINTYGFGETDLAVPTPDDTYEPLNRRVEIVRN